MSVASFYGGDHKGSVFGYSAEYGPDFHYGQDIKRHPSGTPIPSLSTGRIVRSEWQSSHGWFVSVDSGDGWFWTYSHMDAQGFPVGTSVGIGTSLGSVGSTGQSTGPHTHVQRTRNPLPWVHGTEVDPWPQIAQIITSSSGGGTRPIPRKEIDMSDYGYYTRKNPTTGRDEWMLSHPTDFPDGVFITSDFNIAQGMAPFTGNSYSATEPGRWEGILKVAKIAYDAAWAAEERRAALYSGGSGGDSASVIAHAVDETLRPRFENIPSAEENGQAARSAIVKS